jgi:hypothetical protein
VGSGVIISTGVTCITIITCGLHRILLVISPIGSDGCRLEDEFALVVCSY